MKDYKNGELFSNGARYFVSPSAPNVHLQAVAAFILEVVSRHGAPAELVCAKEPFLMTQAGYLVTAFPRARVLHMVRDGRAISHSLVSRNLEFPPFSNTDHAQNLKQWASLASGYCRHSSPGYP